MTADPTAKATAVNEFRLRYLRLLYGASDEHSDDSVPADKRADFRDHVQHDKEFAEQWFERSCKRFGSAGGAWDGVPEKNRAACLRNAGYKLADFANDCEYELDLLRIDLEQEADEEFDEAVKV